MFKKLAITALATLTFISFGVSNNTASAAEKVKEEEKAKVKVVATHNMDYEGNKIKIEELDIDGLKYYAVRTKLNKEKYEGAADAVDAYITENLEPNVSAMYSCTINYYPATGSGWDGDARATNEADSCWYNSVVSTYQSHTVKSGGWIEGRWYGSTLPDSIKISAQYDFNGWALSLSYGSIGFTKIDGDSVKWSSKHVSGVWYL